MRIALAVPPAWSTMTAPLGIASVSGALIDAGHEVKIFDINIRLWNLFKAQDEDLWDYSNYLIWQDKEKFEATVLPLIDSSFLGCIEEIVNWDPEVLGFSVFDTSIHSAQRLAQLMKKRNPQIKIIFGGPHIIPLNIDRTFYFNGNGLDLAIVGEGEATLVEVIQRLSNHQSIDGCLGVIHRNANGNIVIEPTRPAIQLSNLAFPDFSNFKLKEYKEFKLPIMMSRGCIAKCTFCGETQFWKNFRYREAHHILAELRNGERTFQVRNFTMADSLVNGNFRVLSELADLIIQSKTRIFWNGYARIDHRMTPHLLKRLHKSGCTYLSYGLETGSQKIMDLMEKKTTVEIARQVIRDTHAAGISVHVNIVIGFPGETETDFQKTIDFLKQNIGFISIVNTGETLGIIPGTPLFSAPKEFGIRTDVNGEIVWKNGGWVSEDGSNNHEVRRDRLTRLRKMLDQYDHIQWYPSGRPIARRKWSRYLWIYKYLKKVLTNSW